MPIPQRWRGVFALARAYMPLLVELGMTYASGVMATLLLSDQSYFDRYDDFFGFLLKHWVSQEWVYGALALTACLLKLVGLIGSVACRRQPLCRDICFVLRIIGWGCSVVFWGCFCATITVGAFLSLGSALSAVATSLAIGATFMGPAMPEDGDG